LAALVVVFVFDGGDRNDERAAANAVMSYVKARRADDAHKACEQLSIAQRRELVAQVSRTPPSKSSPRDCERHVLAHSRWSELVRPALARFRIAGARSAPFSSDVRLVRPSGFDTPVLAVWKRDGEWRIDAQAAERSAFVRVCADEGVSRCGCVFDHARAMDPRVLDRGEDVMDLIAAFETGERRTLLREIVRRCDRGDDEQRPTS
jgi:hypothetical protein